MKREFAMPVIVLTAICFAATLLLAVVYGVTEPLIVAQKEAVANAARAEVLSEADGFTKLDGEWSGDVTEVYKADNGSGYVFNVIADGFGGSGSLNIMVGIKSDGTVSAVKLVEHSETQGLGSNVGEKDYTAQYIGADSSLSGVDSISGASVSSAAFKAAVADAFAQYNEMKGAGNNEK